ncbi:hypothetical protein PINS_up017842 [Pythium insidiosum]|nr:hypothetical protein PINS_up017842 [Pythium insidiosum]
MCVRDFSRTSCCLLRNTVAEITVKDGKVWYDISVIPTGNGRGPEKCSSLADCERSTGGTGFNKAMQISPVGAGGGLCRPVTCMHKDVTTPINSLTTTARCMTALATPTCRSPSALVEMVARLPRRRRPRRRPQRLLYACPDARANDGTSYAIAHSVTDSVLSPNDGCSDERGGCAGRWIWQPW